jgi:copper chaperone CopZ
MATIATHHISVSDMKCNGCETTIEHELRHQQGVERVSANHIQGTVEIEGAEDLDLNALADSIDDLGFSAST